MYIESLRKPLRQVKIMYIYKSRCQTCVYSLLFLDGKFVPHVQFESSRSEYTRIRVAEVANLV